MRTEEKRNIMFMVLSGSHQGMKKNEGSMVMVAGISDKERSLPLARSGRRNENANLSVVMLPYEKFSPFPKAVDLIYKNCRIPFHLIVVEGNAPDCVRFALEKRQKSHQNITIIYSRFRPCLSSAVNLAIPHIRTEYVFFMDNGVNFEKGMMERLMACARENKSGIVFPRTIASPADSPEEGHGRKGKERTTAGQYGLKNSFLISREAIDRIGRFEENLNPLVLSMELPLIAKKYGIKVCEEKNVCFQCSDSVPLKRMDQELFSVQWSDWRVANSVSYLKEKWGVGLKEEEVLRWVRRKRDRISPGNQPFDLLDKWNAWASKLTAAGRSAVGMFF